MIWNHKISKSNMVDTCPILSHQNRWKRGEKTSRGSNFRLLRHSLNVLIGQSWKTQGKSAVNHNENHKKSKGKWKYVANHKHDQSHLAITSNHCPGLLLFSSHLLCSIVSMVTGNKGPHRWASVSFLVVVTDKHTWLEFQCFPSPSVSLRLWKLGMVNYSTNQSFRRLTAHPATAPNTTPTSVSSRQRVWIYFPPWHLVECKHILNVLIGSRNQWVGLERAIMNH